MRTRRLATLPDPLPVLLVAAVLLVAWELLAWAYFTASVSPVFTAGPISRAAPRVPAEMRLVQTSVPFPHLVL